MNVAVRLAPEAHQSLLVTRQTIQAVEILEYGLDELDAFLQDQSARNPLLRVTPPRARAARSLSLPRGARAGPSRDGAGLVEALTAEPQGLRQDLLRQLSLARMEQRTRFLAAYLVESLDDAGYLRTDLDVIGDMLGAGEDELTLALREVQKLEPTGVGARSLRECLHLQLLEQGPVEAPVRALLDNLELVGSGNPGRLARLCGVDREEIPSLLRRLRKLDPRPGHRFAPEPTEYAPPDILVTATPDGGLKVEVNPDLLPRVLIDNEYYAELSGRMTTAGDRTYLRGCLQEAGQLVRNLDQRARTTLAVAAAIVRHQSGFFREGAKALRPLSQKDIARAAEIHESTVSRAIANRYLLCSRGQFPLKFFFSDGLSAAGSESIAASVIRERIREMVKGETAAGVLSDDDIVSRLRREGTSVARRTVAKYRGQLRIPPSTERRRRLAFL
uniref:RNA polymerase factor sigma-54 n=1 Tax=Stappia sp. TaxID=1870903 RepID=UPI003BAA5DB7